VVLTELELNGYTIERVYEHDRLIGARLLKTDPLPRPSPAGANDRAAPRDSYRPNTALINSVRRATATGRPAAAAPAAARRSKR
jgi:hypothetical protein